MKLFRWLKDNWHSLQRAMDIEFLWPTCVKNAPDITLAQAAFAFHAFHDESWLMLGEDEIIRRIDELPYG